MKKKTPMTDHEFAVILEDIRSQFRVFGEGLAGIREKMDERFIQLEKRLLYLEEGIARIQSDVYFIKNNIKVKVDIEEFQNLENRVIMLEKKLSKV